MKYRSLLLILPLILISCNKDRNNNIENIWLNFYSRPVTELSLYPAGLKLDEDFDYQKYDTWNGMEGEDIPVDAFYLCLKTSDTAFRPHARVYEIGGIDETRLKNEATNELERNIAASFDKYVATTRTVREVIDYRTTGVSNIQITANVAFAGKAAGESLNDLFTLKDFEPNIIINKESEEIVVSWGDREHFPTTIEEWLAYEPMAQTYMSLFLAVVPQILPKAIIFSIDLTTDTGEVLHCQTPEVHLISE